MTAFGLVEGTVPDGEGGEIAVYFLDVTTWSIIYSFMLTGDPSLTPPCSMTTFPFNLP
jgi:hypothetical protein